VISVNSTCFLLTIGKHQAHYANPIRFLLTRTQSSMSDCLLEPDGDRSCEGSVYHSLKIQEGEGRSGDSLLTGSGALRECIGRVLWDVIDTPIGFGVTLVRAEAAFVVTGVTFVVVIVTFAVAKLTFAGSLVTFVVVIVTFAVTKLTFVGSLVTFAMAGVTFVGSFVTFVAIF
jgi:hypothetical protein